jgi:hypothetical protein
VDRSWRRIDALMVILAEELDELTPVAEEEEDSPI